VRSKKLEDVKSESAALADAGYREIVLVGINLSAYRDGENDLCDAVQAASAPENVLRVRLGSLEPDHLTADVVERLAKCEKLCPQFHISLQSGCDATLRRMNRHYTAEEYRALCELLRHSFDDCTLTTDMMAGFPGETEADHEASLRFAKEIGFEKVHVFPFSPRRGTRASDMPDPVPRAVREQRALEIAEAMEEVRRAFLLRQIGRTLYVLPEEDAHGFTANYTPVHILGDCPADGTIVPVRITGAGADCCIGESLH
jgi:threonylcarbamoyladenosine tRNA methylthiotransferase MtaB